MSYMNLKGGLSAIEKDKVRHEATNNGCALCCPPIVHVHTSGVVSVKMLKCVSLHRRRIFEYFDDEYFFRLGDIVFLASCGRVCVGTYCFKEGGWGGERCCNTL